MPRIRQTRAATEDAALLRRELTHLGRSAVYLLNCTMGGILLLTGSVYALLRRDVLAAILAQNSELRAELLPLTAGIILLLCAMGIVTAPSVSLEGRSLWIVQSLPVEPWQVLRAKLRLHLLCVGAPALVSAVLLAAALRLGAVQAVLLMLLTLAFVFFGAQTGLLWGLRLPNLTWRTRRHPQAGARPRHSRCSRAGRRYCCSQAGIFSCTADLHPRAFSPSPPRCLRL